MITVHPMYFGAPFAIAPKKKKKTFLSFFSRKKTWEPDKFRTFFPLDGEFAAFEFVEQTPNGRYHGTELGRFSSPTDARNRILEGWYDEAE